MNVKDWFRFSQQGADSSATNDPPQIKTAIIGGGPIGMIQAIALAARGMKATVYEKSSGDGAGDDGGLTLNPRTVNWLQSLGFNLDRISTNPRLSRRDTDQGSRQQELTQARIRTTRRLLFREARRVGVNVDYRPDHELVEINQKNKRYVRLRFANGERAEVDLTVGADGANSTTRRLAFGKRARNRGFLQIRGIVTRSDLGEELWQKFGDKVYGYSGKNGSFTSYPVLVPGPGGRLVEALNWDTGAAGCHRKTEHLVVLDLLGL